MNSGARLICVNSGASDFEGKKLLRVAIKKNQSND